VSVAENPVNVLVVDDDEPTRMLIAKMISQGVPEARVALAGTCERALTLASAKSYDVILLDLLMPGIGGFEVLRRIRTASANQSTPVIVVSVLGAEAKSAEQCRLLGADQVISKPVTREVLAAAVKAQLAAKAER
jgi:CheY-like chemotaxis protein